jgi:hypothetical protein
MLRLSTWERQMTRLRSTRAASVDGAVTVQASSHLMDDYVYATDLTGETDLTAVQQTDGSYSLLYLGASGNVMSLRQNPGSDTGWSEETIDTTLQPSQVVGAADAAGRFVAFAIGSNAAAPDIYLTTRQATGTWSAPQPVAPDDSVPIFLRVTNFAALTIDGKVELFALLGPSPGHSGNSSLWRIDWSAAQPKWQYIADSDQNTIESCTVAGKPGILFGNTAASDPTKVDLFTVAAPFTGVPSRLAATLAFSSLAVGTQADRNSAVFIADNGYSSGVRQIQYLDGGKPAAGFVQIDTAITATALAVGSAGATPLALFALDQKGQLQFIASPVSAGSEQSYEFFLRFTGILTATGEDGDAELLGYVPGKGLMRLWKSPPDPQSPSDPTGDKGGWTHDWIKYQPLNQKLSQQSTYATTLTFYDAKGVVIAESDIELKSTEIVTATIGGEVLVLGPDQPVVCRTDGAGRVRITTPTNTLNVAGLSARMPGLMQAVEDFAIAPNYGVQERLRKITEDDVRKLVPPAYASSAPHIKQAVQDSMLNIPEVHLVRQRVGAGADLRTPLGLREQPGQAFHFRVANGRAVHRRLTNEEAAAAIAEIRLGAPAGLWDSFENLIEAIRNAFQTAAQWTYDYVVEPLVSGFKLAIKLVVDTVTFVWEGIIDTVEAAFRLAETVFEAVKTTFERLYAFYAWLLTGDVRKEIWATKRQFEKIFNQGMTALAGYARQGGSVSHTFFLDKEEFIRQVFAQIERDFGVTDTNQAIDAKPPGGLSTFLEIIEEASSIANWLLDKITPSLGNWVGIGIDIPANLLEKARILIGQIESAFVNELAGLISGFVGRMQALVTSTQEFGNVLLATILGQAKDLVLAILRLVDSIVQHVLTFFASELLTLNTIVFGAKIDNSVAQALYDLINPGAPEDLAMLGLGSLLCAFVATPLYRLLFGEAPFPLDRQDGVLTGTNKELGIFLILSGLVQGTLWCFTDIFLDVTLHKPNPPPIWVALMLAILGPSIVQLLAWPGGPGAVLKFETPVAKATSVAWLSGFAAPAFKFLWSLGVIAGKVKGGPRGSVVGSSVLCACGGLGWGMNWWMLTEKGPNASLSEWIAAGAGPMSPFVKPAHHLLKSPVREWFLGIIDAVSDVGAGIAKVVHGAELINSGAVLAAPAAASRPQNEGGP